VVAREIDARLQNLPHADDRYLAELRSHGYALMDEGSSFAFDRPVAIVSGRQDRIAGWENQLETLDRYPAASFTLLDGAGHLPPLRATRLLPRRSSRMARANLPAVVAHPVTSRNCECVSRPVWGACQVGAVWSIYGAKRAQPVATGGKWEDAENGSNKPIGNRWQPTATVPERMVRRGSTVRVRQRALQKRRTPALSRFLVQTELLIVDRPVHMELFMELSRRELFPTAWTTAQVASLCGGEEEAGRGDAGPKASEVFWRHRGSRSNRR
jgi:hypothetical protein